MSAYFFYVDESHDAQKFCLSALCIRHRLWKDCFRQVREFRTRLRESHGMYLRKEIHAAEFVAGRGDIATKDIGKHERSRIFLRLLELVAQLPHVFIINICLEKHGGTDPQLEAWDRLLNRIERTMKEFESTEVKTRTELVALQRERGLPPDVVEPAEKRLLAFRARAVIIADEGREREITRVLRKMAVFNPIPSRFGRWGPGIAARNITTERIIEDPVFKSSHQSHFLQLADCIAYALLKREVEPTRNVKRYGIDKMFDAALTRVCYTRASAKDPLGIVRK